MCPDGESSREGLDVPLSRQECCMFPNGESWREKFDVARSRQGCRMCPEIVRVQERNLMLLRADGDAVCATVQQ